MSLVVEPEPIVTLPVVGTDARFPVTNIYCVGRNYADHAIEMGHDPDREPPFFFIKPAYSVLQNRGQMIYPAFSQDVHHEVEMVVAIKEGGVNIPVDTAIDHIFGYGVGIDMTRRDLQQLAKDQSRPWEAGKSFVHAAPCSSIVSIGDCGEMNNGAISLSINGQTRQSGDINQMIWKVTEVISRISSLFLLQPGDLIYTGTPAGVGPITRGDEICARLEGVGELMITVEN